MASLLSPILPHSYFWHSDDPDATDDSSSDVYLSPESSDDDGGAHQGVQLWVEDEDSDEHECRVDPLGAHPESQYWKVDRAADAWLARHPGGTRLLYPQLLVVGLRGGLRATPLRDPTVSHSIFSLPAEIRVQIYKYYFRAHEEVERPKNGRVPFLDRAGKEIRRINLTSEDFELRFWLSTALLQTSRQLRFEAMPVFFNNCVFTVDWLLALPRFVNFLGNEGCAMVRYMDIWDLLGFQRDESNRYRDIIASLTHLPHLQHLRIVLSAVGVERLLSWFDATEFSEDGTLEYKRAVPKIRREDIDRHWPEYEALKILKARKFTLALETQRGSRYLEFDQKYGAYPEIAESMQTDLASRPMPLWVPISSSPTSREFLEGFQVSGIQPRSHDFLPSSKVDDDCDNTAWQETHALTNRAIPLYNFVRAYFHHKIYLPSTEERFAEAPWRHFVNFPTACRSTGGVIRDCGFCYMSDGHCGHHAMPDQLPFGARRPLSNEEEDAKMMQETFKNMPLVNMMAACREAVKELHTSAEWLNFLMFLTYFGAFETSSEIPDALDHSADSGSMGDGVDKEKAAPWDILYRELKAFR